MTDYTKLVKELRGCKYIDYCKDCPRMAANGYVEICNIKDDAAAAIEALQAEVPKRGEIVRCGECKYHLPETERTNPYCNRFHCMKPDDWYCADGEREVQE